MKRIIKTLMVAAAASVALPALAMPVGLRTAVWGVSAANGRTALARLLPETDSTAEIKVALKAFSDKTVAANIVEDSEYEEFREWALESGARADALTASATAYLSFAAGSPVLVAEPQDGDLVIDEVSPMGVDGTIEMVFSLVNVQIAREALENRLKSVFSVAGAKALKDAEFSESNLVFSLLPTDDGRVKAVITTKKSVDGKLPTSFFMRVKMKQ